MNNLPDPVPFPRVVPKPEIRCVRCGFMPRVVLETPLYMVVVDHGRFRCWLIRTAKRIGW